MIATIALGSIAVLVWLGEFLFSLLCTPFLLWISAKNGDANDD